MAEEIADQTALVHRGLEILHIVEPHQVTAAMTDVITQDVARQIASRVAHP
jgi:hypothetical protein